MPKRLKSAVLAAVLALTAPLVITPAAQAGGYIYAGNIYEHHWRGGSSMGLFITYQGNCDSSGYVVNLHNTGVWDTKISSFVISGNQGCNAAKVYGKNGQVYSYTQSGVTYNAPAGWNDSADKIRFYHL